MENCLTPEELADRWHMNPKTLRNWRCFRMGPPFMKIGRRVFYREADVARWEETKLKRVVR